MLQSESPLLVSVPGSPLVTRFEPEAWGFRVHAAMCHTIFWSGAIALSSCSSFSTVGIVFPCSYRAWAFLERCPSFSAACANVSPPTLTLPAQ